MSPAGLDTQTVVSAAWATSRCRASHQSFSPTSELSLEKQGVPRYEDSSRFDWVMPLLSTTGLHQQPELPQVHTHGPCWPVLTPLCSFQSGPGEPGKDLTSPEPTVSTVLPCCSKVQEQTCVRSQSRWLCALLGPHLDPYSGAQRPLGILGLCSEAWGATSLPRALVSFWARDCFHVFPKLWFSVIINDGSKKDRK